MQDNYVSIEYVNKHGHVYTLHKHDRVERKSAFKNMALINKISPKDNKKY